MKFVLDARSLPSLVSVVNKAAWLDLNCSQIYGNASADKIFLPASTKFKFLVRRSRAAVIFVKRSS